MWGDISKDVPRIWNRRLWLFSKYWEYVICEEQQKNYNKEKPLKRERKVKKKEKKNYDR